MPLTAVGIASIGKMNPESKIEGTIIKIATNMACCCVCETREISNPKEIITAT